MLTQPAHTRAFIAHSRRKPVHVVPVYILKPTRLSNGERAWRRNLRARMARALRRKGGIGYIAALKYVSQLALPRIEGTISLARARGERVSRLAGMVC